MSSVSLSVFVGVTAALLVQLLCLCHFVYSSRISLSNDTDRSALLKFKSMISADPLGVLNSWNDSTHFCKWYGVSCSKRHHGRVTALYLPYQTLSGSISPHVGNLSFLKKLDLAGNNFIGEIPPEIGRLFRLQVLSFYKNSIGGEIPSNISGCSAITTFDVGYNKLVGGIPWQFSVLKKLQKVGVEINHLNGSILSTVGNLSSLQYFDGGDNQFSGKVADTLGQLKYIRVLVLGINNLHGEIPASIFNLSSLMHIWLGENQFCGNLPQNLGILLPNLQTFDVDFNHFTGSIPPSLSNASNLVLLQLDANNFTGSVPSMEGCNKLTNFAIARNSLGSGRANDMSFLSSLTNTTRLIEVHIQENNFGGSLPQNIGNLSTSLEQLSFNDNKISGNIPNGIQYLIHLERIWGHNNNLSGTIPKNIGNLKSLEELYLYNNKIVGYIPSSVGNLTKLSELHIGANRLYGEIPASIQNCKQMSLLIFGSNNLSGVISPQISSLTSLTIVLDLSYNQFTGAIPIGVGNLNKLGTLDLSHNMLSNNIPSSLGGCISLQYLYLEVNHLQGTIPSSLSSLRGLQELNLSTNDLCGQIPKYLEIMNISILDLSHNNFEGEVPEQGVFKNSSSILVIGNNKLCGGIVALKLPPCSLRTHSNKTLSLKWNIVISIISSLLFLTLVGSCFFILLIKKRRQHTVSKDDMKFLQLSFDKLFKATDGFSSTNQIGVGSFGTVYKGVVLDDINETYINVAVKVFNLQRQGASKSFMAECEALKNIKHKNLVKIVTVCSSIDHKGNDFKALIYEYLGNGSLEIWLHRPVERINKSTTLILNFLQRINISIDIASAIDYLHNHCGTPIIHCDLKPNNVLLDEDMMAHVGDFGLSKFLWTIAKPSSSSIGIKGTIGYAPPEYGMGNEVSIQGDVYSYGILLLELFTGKRPTDDTFRDGLTLHNIVKSALLKLHSYEVLDSILLNELLHRLETQHNYSASRFKEVRKDLEELMSSILEIGVTCSSEIPEERLNMSEVLSRLTAIKGYPWLK